MFMVMTAAVAVLVVVVMMFMVVTAAVAVLVVVVVMFMVMTAAVAVLIVVVMMFMVVTAAVAILIVIVMMMMLACFLKKLLQLVVKSILLSNCVHKLNARKLVPVGSYNGCNGIKLPYKSNALVKLFLGNALSVAENYTACICYLIVEELAEILAVHSALLCVNYRCEAVENYIM